LEKIYGAFYENHEDCGYLPKENNMAKNIEQKKRSTYFFVWSRKKNLR